ncbi:MAG: HEAT repeat domain-containing protein [Planctomycetes bacterium]|nr:HEAT repeat domain-containing protein [Planctomycetota bacterium]
MLKVRFLSLALLLATVAPAQDPDAALTELLRLKDDADLALVSKISATKSREAAAGLVKAYDVVNSLLMQREILRALATFRDNAEAEQPAMQKLASIAGTSEDADLRSLALAALGQSTTIGKHFLKQLVDSDASDEVREPALREHVRTANAADDEWYRFLWNLKGEQRKDKDGKIQGPELGPIRELAFDGLKQALTEDELIDTLRRETDPKIRRAALDTMRARNLPKTGEMAAWALDRVDWPGGDRAEAARILADREGVKVVPTFLELAKKRDVTPDNLRAEMAKLIVAMHDDATNKKLAKMVGKGKPHEKVFALLAAGRFADLKVLKKELADPALEVRRAAANVLASLGGAAAVVELRALLSKGRNPGDARLAIETIGEIEKGNDTWLGELEAFAKSNDVDVRNAAVEQIGIGRNKKQVPVLLAALEHDDWSTRFAAVEGLLSMKDKRAVGPLIERMAKDPGRLGKRISEVLWEFTAQPYGENSKRWQSWWAEAAPKFSIVSQKDLDLAAKAREEQRLKQRTRSTAKFFGLQVESHRVIFVLDVSGSMLESMYGRYVGKRGAARIDVAKQEVKQAIENLDEGALFNVFAFSSGVEKWQKESAGTNSPASRQAALTWVERLGAAGATNLYDSLKLAFADKDVDTIYVMSDGEPTNGEVIDPFRIREEVAFWNKHRKIKIHTVAIGSNLEVLEWLAADSGGKHVKMR